MMLLTFYRLLIPIGSRRSKNWTLLQRLFDIVDTRDNAAPGPEYCKENLTQGKGHKNILQGSTINAEDNKGFLESVKSEV